MRSSLHVSVRLFHVCLSALSVYLRRCAVCKCPRVGLEFSWLVSPSGCVSVSLRGCSFPSALCLFTCPCVSVCIRLCLCVLVCFCVSAFVCGFPCLRSRFCRCLCASLCVSVFPSVCLCVPLCAPVSVPLSARVVSECLLIYVSLCVSVFFVCLCV